MKKGDMNKLVRVLAKGMTVFHCYFDGDVYLSEGHFIVRTTAENAQYMIDRVNERKRKTTWRELSSLPSFYDMTDKVYTWCDKIERGEVLKDKRKIIKLLQKDYVIRLDDRFCLDGGDFYSYKPNSPVLEYVSNDAVLFICPIFTPEEIEDDQV